ncbi:hypothetical protein [Methylomagnum ishizawai]|uniref:hypothetical protein n=1 Tax=Methylomagnum ishizawai TaxID=1760988 RepID=UPI001C802008|nr:hypothetical protein [Methylomagnum ishizawai]
MGKDQKLGNHRLWSASFGGGRWVWWLYGLSARIPPERARVFIQSGERARQVRAGFAGLLETLFIERMGRNENFFARFMNGARFKLQRFQIQLVTNGARAFSCRTSNMKML